MRTTVTIDQDVFEAAQSLADSSGQRLGAVLSQLARRGLRAETSTARKNGLPVFSVSPDAQVIPSSRAHQLLADELT